MEYTTALLIIAIVLGGIVGSFLNVVILRLPQEDASVVFPASHCPKCHTPLAWFENIPLLSYCVLRGKCRTCKVHISWQYPLVELSMALLSGALMYTFGPSFEFCAYFLFCASLLSVIFIDIQHQIIPDSISKPGIILGVLFSLFSTQLTWVDSIIGVIAGGGVLYAIAWGYFILRRQDGMGGGDIKLLAMLGAWLGWQSLPFIIFVSSFVGAIIGIIALRLKGNDSSTRIPFGPFLSVSAIVYLFFATEIQYFFHLYLTGQWP